MAGLQQPRSFEDHAFLSPSNYHWVNYTDDKLRQTWRSREASKLGTRLHAFAQECIELGQKLEPAKYPTVAMYVNDCVDFGMFPEVRLECDEDCYGTADALLLKHGTLRIWDLKTGTNRAHHLQVCAYAAIFCLENQIDPLTLQYDLRIYQNCTVKQVLTHPGQIRDIAQKIVNSVAIIQEEKRQRYY